MGYYKKKKVIKYKKRMKKENNGNHKKIDSSCKQLDISEVLYLIIQQIGFMPFDYWNNMPSNDKALFPQYPLIENIARKGKKSKLFDNDGSENLKLRQYANANGKKKKLEQKNNDSESEQEDDDDDDSDETVTSSEEEEEEDEMQWNLFSEKLRSHKGNTWSL